MYMYLGLRDHPTLPLLCNKRLHSGDTTQCNVLRRIVNRPLDSHTKQMTIVLSGSGYANVLERHCYLHALLLHIMLHAIH